MKKFLAITLALVMTFAMVACGGTSSSTPASTPASGTGAAEPAAEGGEIVIGCLQDITGATSALGMSVQAGAQAAVDEINAAGGIGGKTVVMKTYDTKGDVTEAVNAYITAVTVDNVSLIVGPPVANIANAIKETSEDYDVPVMGFALDPNCQLKEDGTPYKNMFCFQPSATTQGQIMASFAVKNDLKTFGIIYNQENSYSCLCWIRLLNSSPPTASRSMTALSWPTAPLTPITKLCCSPLYRREWTRSTARTIPSSWWPS